jgi:GrpB-like predicted nucleotidyltransferase (UPF0157 family)
MLKTAIGVSEDLILFPMIDLVQPYNPEWKKEFEHLKQNLEALLSGLDTDIQHVGSTSVPGLVAKPILDIDIIIQDKTLLDDITALLERAGYRNRGEQGIPGRFAFRQTDHFTPLTKTSKNWLTHHLYVCFSQSLALKNHLVFRDALLRDRELVDKYSQLKKALCEDHGMTREMYTKRKTDFIISVLTELGLDAKELNDIKDANE